MNRGFLIRTMFAFANTKLILFYLLATIPAQAQQKPETPSERIIYMRADTVFEMRADGVETPLLPKAKTKGDTLYFNGDSAYFIISRPEIKTLELNSWQGLDRSDVYGWVTDSIKWVPTDTTFEGEPDCNHDWVYGEPDIAGYGFATSSCFVYHPPGQHCDFYNDVREKICRHCLHSEIEREQWYQRFVEPPKTEFQKLKEKQRARQ